MHKTTKRFWVCFDRLTQPAQNAARGKFALLKKNPGHPSLHFKKVGEFWSARIGLDYRALAVKDDFDFTWVWIGTHEEYERLIK